MIYSFGIQRLDNCDYLCSSVTKEGDKETESDHYVTSNWGDVLNFVNSKLPKEKQISDLPQTAYWIDFYEQGIVVNHGGTTFYKSL